jgi:hypothetical protein
MNRLAESIRQAFPPGNDRCIRLPVDRPIVFVGDIHGDIEAVHRIFASFSQEEYVVVFMGDLVDRGLHSHESLSSVVKAKLASPGAIHLLMGNHEAWAVQPFQPADYWLGLHPEEREEIADALLALPYAAWHPAGLLSVHGALPDLPSVAAIDQVVAGSEIWRAMTWGDLSENSDDQQIHRSRPLFGSVEFDRRMQQLGVRALVRSHQPSAPTYQFNDRCLTLFTSSAYGLGPRRVAVLSPGQIVSSARDLTLLELQELSASL